MFCDLKKNECFTDLEWMSLLGLVDCGQDGLVDPEAHGGGHQGQGEVPNYAGIQIFDHQEYLRLNENL